MMLRKVLFALTLYCATNSVFALETTVYGKIVGIETRTWGLHVQTEFSGGVSLGCPVTVGDVYMYDFIYGNTRNSELAAMEKTVLLTAFSTGKDVSFHLYECNSNNTRPIIGYIRVR
jgi:hypothetical protein